jgi:hypothetical protein
MKKVPDKLRKLCEMRWGRKYGEAKRCYIPCPACESHMRVQNTRGAVLPRWGNVVLRYRVCPECGEHLKTIEHPWRGNVDGTIFGERDQALIGLDKIMPNLSSADDL